jgi:formylglycine-generating enzyme required for sulfatase activity
MGTSGKSCCMPVARGAAGDAADACLHGVDRADAADATIALHDAPRLLALPGGEFLMGGDDTDGFPEDGEGPPRRVTLSPFRIAPTAVTNREFAAFVRATRYVTDAERAGASFVFYLQTPEAVRREIRRVPAGLPWWLPVPHACWQRPEGPGSHIHARQDHPVVHVSWFDAQAYCAWAGRCLPTEAQWEYAARGGLHGRRYPWGDELEPDGHARCNIWRGDFPGRPAPGWRPGTVPVSAYGPNGLGLYNMAGNVWEWCADHFTPTYHRDTAALDPQWQDHPHRARDGMRDDELARYGATGRRSMRGGSFLCHASYCNRYRVAARNANTPDSTSSNCGFRVAAR